MKINCDPLGSSFIHPSGYNSPTKTWTAIYEIQVKIDNERQLNICLGKKKKKSLPTFEKTIHCLSSPGMLKLQILCVALIPFSKRVLHLSAMGWAPEPLKRSHPHMRGYSANYFILCPLYLYMTALGVKKIHVKTINRSGAITANLENFQFANIMNYLKHYMIVPKNIKISINIFLKHPFCSYCEKVCFL